MVEPHKKSPPENSNSSDHQSDRVIHPSSHYDDQKDIVLQIECLSDSCIKVTCILTFFNMIVALCIS